MTSRDLHIQTRQLFTIVGSISVLLVLAQVAHASTVIGVTGAYDNGGSPNTVFEVDVTTGVLTDLGSTGSVVPNSLACNVEENAAGGNSCATRTQNGPLPLYVQ